MSAAPTASTTHRSHTTNTDELARLDQALLDLQTARAASVALVHCPKRSREKTLVRQLSERAREKKCVTSHVSLAEWSPDTPEELLREILVGMVPPGSRKPGSIVQLLDAYGAPSERRRARFEEAANREGAGGDLTELCASYLNRTEPDGRREIRALDAWLNGEEAKGRARNPRVRRVLDGRTAQRVLGELTRIVLALGYRGFVVFLSEGDSIATRPKRKRERAYTVLREIVDNFDAGDGAVAARIFVTGTDQLFFGDRSLQSLPPLLMRLTIPSSAEPVPPHRSWTTLVREPYEYIRRRPTPAPATRVKALRSLIRISEGLPPTEAVASMSVGHEKIERTIDRLFHHMDHSGSAFQMLVGDYGSGKTHLMLHLAERAIDDNRPVFWLNVERMNMDLGHPPRHLSRLLTHSVLPVRGRPTAFSRAAHWTRNPARLRKLQEALEDIESEETEESWAAQKALDWWEEAKDPGLAMENFLTGADLVTSGAGKSKRRDAYRRLLLWIELLKRLEGVNGAVVLIDEAENLYTAGASWSARRTALRSLSFYCGGALPSSAVVMAMTPPAYEQLTQEAKELLQEADEASSTLDLEDVELFSRRLSKLKPDLVPQLSRTQRLELVDKVRRTHRSVRGPVEIPDWKDRASKWVQLYKSPRVLIRAVIDELESIWWRG